MVALEIRQWLSQSNVLVRLSKNLLFVIRPKYRPMEKADFVKLMEGVHCAAMVNACLSFGHELGVFDVLLSAEEPVSLQFIADSKNLKER